MYVQRNPMMAEAILNDNLPLLEELLEEQYKQRRLEMQRRNEEIVRAAFPSSPLTSTNSQGTF